MITKWCIIVSDIDETEFFLIGPMGSKMEAAEFDSELYACDIITTIHPYIPGIKWIGRKALREMFSSAETISTFRFVS